MAFYAWMYHFYRTALVRTLRLLIFVLLSYVIVSAVLDQKSFIVAQFWFNLFVMVEIFFQYKISRVMPSLTVVKNTKDKKNSFTLSVLATFISYPTTKKMMKKFLKQEEVVTFLHKMAISQQDIILQDIPKDKLLETAFDVAKMYGGKYVIAIDIVLAYFIRTEPQTKLLFNKEIKPDDLKYVMFWIRKTFAASEEPKKTRMKFEGGSIGDILVSGWTYETKKYTTNFTDAALSEQPVILGREQSFTAMLEGLVKVQDNNILLVGDIGSGKENLVRALAYHSFEGHLGSLLSHRRVYQLLVGPLTAGISSRSDLEVRLQSIIAELSHSHDVILYIPDFQNVVGGSSYNLDISGALLPYLKSGSMPVVATMTTGAYKTYMEKNPLKEAFSIVSLISPEKHVAIQMVLDRAKKIERTYGVLISFQAIEKAVELADRFLQDESLPGSAVGLLETVANSVSLSPESSFDKSGCKIVLASHVVSQVEETTHIAIGKPDAMETDLLLHLEERMHDRVIGQDQAIHAVAEAMRRIRAGMKASDRPISFLFLGPTGVGKTETAKTLAALYYGGETQMIRLDMSEYTDETGLRRLLGAPPGEGDERGELTDKIHDNPSSVVLLDEFEKAHPHIHNLFLQVLDDGRLTDNKGVTVSFRDAIIIATSNAGSEFIREEIGRGATIDRNFHHKLLDYLQTKALFRPELLNRFNDVITFKPLDNDQSLQVVHLLLAKLESTLADQDISLVVVDAVKEKIAKEGFDQDFGARPLRRYIQDNLEDMIAKKKLEGSITRGNTVTFSLDPAGKVQLTVS